MFLYIPDMVVPFLPLFLFSNFAQSAAAVEYTDCFSEEE